MSKLGALYVCAAIFSAVFSTTASTATKTASFQVGATVIAACTIAPDLGAARRHGEAVCARIDHRAVLPPPPRVTLSPEAATGIVRRTIEF